jgi:DNA-binding MarR family transcriptional regulator
LYENVLRPFGLSSTQFTVLQSLSLAGEVSQGQLGEILAMDSTSLTRTLAIMRRHRWIEERRGTDRRERKLRLARQGETRFHRALPVWNKVQRRLRHRLGDEDWKKFLQLADHVTNMVTTKGEST